MSETTQSIRVETITDANPHTINCPCCGKPRLTVNEVGVKNAGGSKYFLDDGDTIQGIGKMLRPEQQVRETYTAVLEVGTCSACGGRYFIVDVALVDSLAPKGSKDHDFYMECLYGNVPLRHSVQAVCSLDQPIDGVPAQWLMLENLADDKPVQQHWFGPFRLDNAGDVEGINGVAYHGNDAEPWTFGRDLVVKLWDALWALNFERTPERARDKGDTVHRTMSLEQMLMLIGDGIERESDEMILGLLGKAYQDLLDANDPHDRMMTQARGAAISVLGPPSLAQTHPAQSTTDDGTAATREIMPEFGDLFDSL
jgi:hypothetical protein